MPALVAALSHTPLQVITQAVEVIHFAAGGGEAAQGGVNLSAEVGRTLQGEEGVLSKAKATCTSDLVSNNNDNKVVLFCEVSIAVRVYQWIDMTNCVLIKQQ